MAIMYDSKSDTIRQELFKIFREVQDNYNDGFTQWEYKKVLIDVKYILDDMLNVSPTFGSIEADYLKDKEHKQVMDILKK
jgi:hypothetical protein